ncbi:MAG: response regulator transcription factor [Candidatus Brocadiae bacterium]|nr:response regulator transcription factor [Candidatus Brocadiia bacterium]
MKVRVLIADDHQIVCEGLVSLLYKEPDIEVIGKAENGRKAMEMAQSLDPDVVVMDVSMPELNGIESTTHILEKNPRIKIIALSMHSDRQFIFRMFKAGASGYLLKDCAFEELAQAIRLVMKNQTYLSPKIAGLIVENYIASSHEEITDFSSLTSREKEILQLLAEGKSTKQISLSLHISTKTVETHRQHIMDKLQIYSIAELTKYAIREKISPL